MGTFPKFKLRWNNHVSNFVGSLGSLLKSEIFSDVSIFCEGQVWHLHRIVLSASSCHFEQVLANIPIGLAPAIILDGPSASDFDAIIQFIYNGEVSVHQEHLPSLLRTASNLKIKGLADVSFVENVQHPTSTGHYISVQTNDSVPEEYKKIDTTPLNLSYQETKITPKTIDSPKKLIAKRHASFENEEASRYQKTTSFENEEASRYQKTASFENEEASRYQKTIYLEKPVLPAYKKMRTDSTVIQESDAYCHIPDSPYDLSKSSAGYKEINQIDKSSEGDGFRKEVIVANGEFVSKYREVPEPYTGINCHEVSSETYSLNNNINTSPQHLYPSDIYRTSRAASPVVPKKEIENEDKPPEKMINVQETEDIPISNDNLPVEQIKGTTFNHKKFSPCTILTSSDAIHVVRGVYNPNLLNGSSYKILNDSTENLEEQKPKSTIKLPPTSPEYNSLPSEKHVLVVSSSSPNVGSPNSCLSEVAALSPNKCEDKSAGEASDNDGSDATALSANHNSTGDANSHGSQRVTINMRTFKEEWRKQLLVDYDSRTNMSICMLCFTTFKSYDGPRKNTYVKHAKRFHPALDEYSDDERDVIINMYEKYHKYDIDMQKEINKSFRSPNGSGCGSKRSKFIDTSNYPQTIKMKEDSVEWHAETSPVDADSKTKVSNAGTKPVLKSNIQISNVSCSNSTKKSEEPTNNSKMRAKSS